LSVDTALPDRTFLPKEPTADMSS